MSPTVCTHSLSMVASAAPGSTLLRHHHHHHHCCTHDRSLPFPCPCTCMYWAREFASEDYKSLVQPCSLPKSPPNIHTCSSRGWCALIHKTDVGSSPLLAVAMKLAWTPPRRYDAFCNHIYTLSPVHPTRVPVLSACRSTLVHPDLLPSQRIVV
jgi:hypothetical protein